MNDRISHNSIGVELVAGNSVDDDDASSYADELENALEMISELDIDNQEDSCVMYYSIMELGANLIKYNLEFEGVKHQILDIIMNDYSHYKRLSKWVDRALLTGAARHNQDS